MIHLHGVFGCDVVYSLLLDITNVFITYETRISKERTAEIRICTGAITTIPVNILLTHIRIQYLRWHVQFAFRYY